MGAGISNWRLARAVAKEGQLGVVASTGLDTVLVRRLQDGDPGGHMRRAMAQFPWPAVVERLLSRWFRPRRRATDGYGLVPLYRHRPDADRDATVALANFVEVWLAREGHDGEVGINLLTKIQPPTLPALYGAMLAGIGWVLMGAGIPRLVPGALDRLAMHEVAALPYEVVGATAPVELRFDPAPYWAGADPTPLRRPKFVPIVSSHSLATMLLRKANGRVDGFVVESSSAGGHNAPPREVGRFNERGEPVYGARDTADLAVMRELGVPFWLAGGTGTPAGVAAATAAGAAGVQVGTMFAFSRESGLLDSYKAEVFAALRAGTVDVRTDARASPTGYPFKVVEIPGVAASSPDRARICDLGYLRTAYQRPDGRIGHRCPGEPVDQFLAKGGALAETAGRRCLCNALMANIGLAQSRPGEPAELPLLTAGDELKALGSFVGDRRGYSAAEVVAHLLAGA
ncbi:MAG: nitronate monooxygenase [Planctomycetes bacterium]|nr:nitronate monooxygenase [Planctomycetota bacterium]MCC7397249.1 nitronate monooxygenase [Planctomycetota bacterium]